MDIQKFTQDSYKLAVKENQIIWEQDGGILQLILNRPARSNSFTAGLQILLGEYLEKANNDSSVKIIILRANGKNFSGGADLQEGLKLKLPIDPIELDQMRKQRAQTFKVYCEKFINMDKILISCVKGVSIGIGFLFLALCDQVYATEKTLFEAPLLKLALGPEQCSSYSFIELMGRNKTMEVFLQSKRYIGQEMFQNKLINKLFVNEKEMNEYAINVAKELDQMDWESLKQCKKLMGFQYKENLKTILELEIDNYYKRITSPSNLIAQKKLVANLSKTKPKL